MQECICSTKMNWQEKLGKLNSDLPSPGYEVMPSFTNFLDLEELQVFDPLA